MSVKKNFILYHLKLFGTVHLAELAPYMYRSFCTKNSFSVRNSIPLRNRLKIKKKFTLLNIDFQYNILTGLDSTSIVNMTTTGSVTGEYSSTGTAVAGQSDFLARPSGQSVSSSLSSATNNSEFLPPTSKIIYPLKYV